MKEIVKKIVFSLGCLFAGFMGSLNGMEHEIQSGITIAQAANDFVRILTAIIPQQALAHQMYGAHLHTREDARAHFLTQPDEFLLANVKHYRKHGASTRASKDKAARFEKILKDGDSGLAVVDAMIDMQDDLDLKAILSWSQGAGFSFDADGRWQLNPEQLLAAAEDPQLTSRGMSACRLLAEQNGCACLHEMAAAGDPYSQSLRASLGVLYPDLIDAARDFAHDKNKETLHDGREKEKGLSSPLQWKGFLSLNRCVRTDEDVIRLGAQDLGYERDVPQEYTRGNDDRVPHGACFDAVAQSESWDLYEKAVDRYEVDKRVSTEELRNSPAAQWWFAQMKRSMRYNPHALFLFGCKSYLDASYDQALECFSLLSSSGYPWASYMHGLMKSATASVDGDYPSAIASLESAAAKFPYAYLPLADVYVRLKQEPLAIEALEKAAKANVEDARYMLGELYEAQHDYQKAHEVYAMLSDKDDSDALLYDLSKQLIKDCRIQEALPLLRQLVNNDRAPFAERAYADIDALAQKTGSIFAYAYLLDIFVKRFQQHQEIAHSGGSFAALFKKVMALDFQLLSLAVSDETLRALQDLPDNDMRYLAACLLAEKNDFDQAVQCLDTIDGARYPRAVLKKADIFIHKRMHQSEGVALLTKLMDQSVDSLIVDQARAMLTECADQGLVSAQSALADEYIKHDVVACACQWFERAMQISAASDNQADFSQLCASKTYVQLCAAAGRDKRASALLGMLYTSHALASSQPLKEFADIKYELAKGLALLEECATLDNPVYARGAYMLARIYEQEEKEACIKTGVRINCPNALQWYTKAINAGSVSARAQMALLFLEGASEKKAEKAVKKGCELLKEYCAQCMSGVLPEMCGDVDSERLSEAAYALYCGAKEPLFDFAAPLAHDYKLAFELAKIAAARKNLRAQRLLGVMYMKGAGVPQNYEAALTQLNEIVAANRNVNLELGMLMQAHGNYDEAYACFEKAALYAESTEKSFIDQKLSVPAVACCRLVSLVLQKDPRALDKAMPWLWQLQTILPNFASVTEHLPSDVLQTLHTASLGGSYHDARLAYVYGRILFENPQGALANEVVGDQFIHCAASNGCGAAQIYILNRQLKNVVSRPGIVANLAQAYQWIVQAHDASVREELLQQVFLYWVENNDLRAFSYMLAAQKDSLEVAINEFPLENEKTRFLRNDNIIALLEGLGVLSPIATLATAGNTHALWFLASAYIETAMNCSDDLEARIANYKLALECAKKIEIYEGNGSRKLFVGTTLFGIGETYLGLDDVAKAYDYYLMSATCGIEEATRRLALLSVWLGRGKVADNVKVLKKIVDSGKGDPYEAKVLAAYYAKTDPGLKSKYIALAADGGDDESLGVLEVEQARKEIDEKAKKSRHDMLAQSAKQMIKNRREVRTRGVAAATPWYATAVLEFEAGKKPWQEILKLFQMGLGEKASDGIVGISLLAWSVAKKDLADAFKILKDSASAILESEKIYGKEVSLEVERNVMNALWFFKQAPPEDKKAAIMLKVLMGLFKITKQESDQTCSSTSH